MKMSLPCKAAELAISRNIYILDQSMSSEELLAATIVVNIRCELESISSLKDQRH